MAYYRQTAPLLGYYYAKASCGTVDGMAPIDEVAAPIDAVLTASRPHDARGTAVDANPSS